MHYQTSYPAARTRNDDAHDDNDDDGTLTVE
jgi:hypothetical protein